MSPVRRTEQLYPNRGLRPYLLSCSHSYTVSQSRQLETNQIRPMHTGKCVIYLINYQFNLYMHINLPLSLHTQLDKTLAGSHHHGNRFFFPRLMEGLGAHQSVNKRPTNLSLHICGQKLNLLHICGQKSYLCILVALYYSLLSKKKQLVVLAVKSCEL